jgi:hypothetical protein
LKPSRRVASAIRPKLIRVWRTTELHTSAPRPPDFQQGRPSLLHCEVRDKGAAHHARNRGAARRFRVILTERATRPTEGSRTGSRQLAGEDPVPVPPPRSAPFLLGPNQPLRSLLIAVVAGVVVYFATATSRLNCNVSRPRSLPRGALRTIARTSGLTPTNHSETPC